MANSEPDSVHSRVWEQQQWPSKDGHICSKSPLPVEEQPSLIGSVVPQVEFPASLSGHYVATEIPVWAFREAHTEAVKQD